MRVFIAANMPVNVKEHVLEFSKKLQADYKHIKVTWHGLDKYHLTLEFLDELNDEQLTEASDILEQVVDRFKNKKFKLELAEYTAFPSPRNPRALYIKARNKSSHNIADLQRALHNELLNKGFALDNEVWRPHVTLGRIRDGGVKINFEKFSFEPIEFIVTDFSVYSSVLQPTGAVYKQLATYHV